MGLLQPLPVQNGQLTGVENAINSYYEAKDRADEKNRQNSYLQIAAKNAGLVQNDQGAFDLDPYHQALQNYKLEQEKFQTENQPLMQKAGLLEKGVGLIQKPEGGMDVDYTPLKKQELQADTGLKKAHINYFNAAAVKQSGENDTSKGLEAMRKHVDYSGGRAGEMGKVQGRVNAADRLLALATDEKGNIKDLPLIQLPEAAMSAASLIGGGNITEGMVHSFMPSNISRDKTQWVDWWTSNPHGAGQQKFTKLLVDTAMRERAVSNQQLLNSRLSQLGADQGFIKKHPEEARTLLKNYGVDLDEGFHPVPIPGYVQGLLKVQGADRSLSGGAPAMPNVPRIGTVEDGHQFLGGDPSNPKNWKAVQ